MYKLFAEWYRVAGIDPRGDDLPKRWAGIETLTGTMDTTNAVDLARLFLGSTSGSAQFKDQLASRFQNADPAFPMRNNDLELRVLAGAAIAQYVETQSTHTRIPGTRLPWP